MSRPEQRNIVIGTLAGLIGLCALGSCSHSNGSATASRRVMSADFAAPGAPAIGTEREPALAGESAAASQSQTGSDVMVIMGAPANPLAARSGGASADPGAGAGGGAPTAAAARDERLLVDQLVGQINGRPVFANEFFAPMDARMRQMATELTDRQWLVQAKKAIDAALWDKLRDQLLLAEFESALTPEQKQGLFAYIESIRADLVSGNLGSEAQANERLMQTEQIDLDTKVADITRQVFIREQLRKSISSRVQVSYWDVRLYYDQHLDEFVPAPIAKFFVIQAPLSDADKVARITDALARGENFREVAARESTWRPDAGNGLESTIKSREYAAERYFGPEPLNSAVVTLSPGGVTERVDFGGDAWWIMLADIVQPAGKSLYEVQSEIERRLRSERWHEEEIRYFEQLFQRGSFSDVKQMSTRLLEFGAVRYLYQERMSEPPAPGSAPEEVGTGGGAEPPAVGAR